MQQVTETYRIAMLEQNRGRGAMRFKIDVVDPKASADATLSDNGHLYYSSLPEIVFDNIPSNTYATFEPGRWICDGSQLIPSRTATIKQGYVSNDLSLINGVHATPPVVRTIFSVERTFPAITLTFDDTCNDFPKTVTINAYRNGNIVKTVVAHPDSSTFEIMPEDRRGFENVTIIDIIFTDMGKAYRRARLQKILFGYILSIENDIIKSSKFSMEVDPMTRYLPTKKIDFTILNYSGDYDIDNPYGIWRDIEERIPIEAEYGIRISRGARWGDMYEQTWADANATTWGELYDGEYFIWLPAGHFYLDSLPSSRNYEVQFKAITILDFMTEKYYRGMFKNQTLYDVAEDVLRAAGVPEMADGSNPWKLWDGLHNITTSAAMPIVAGREALQLIAHAAQCVLYVDRDGYIRIEPLPDIQYDTKIGFESITGGLPSIEKSPAIKGVKCNVYSYRTSSEIEQVFNGQFTVNANEPITLEYGGQFTDINISISGGTYEAFTNAAIITFTSSGTKDIVITGRRIEPVTTYVSTSVVDARATSIWEELDNPMVTSGDVGHNICKWAQNYWLYRNVHVFNYRGNPEIDALDKIHTQGRFTDDVSAYVINNTINFNSGGYSGNMVLKKVEVE